MTYMYWYMCQNVFQTIQSQLKEIPTLSSLSPGAGSAQKTPGAAPKQAGSETLSSTVPGVADLMPILNFDAVPDHVVRDRQKIEF